MTAREKPSSVATIKGIDRFFVLLPLQTRDGAGRPPRMMRGDQRWTRFLWHLSHPDEHAIAWDHLRTTRPRRRGG